jgi:hypothetical protein
MDPQLAAAEVTLAAGNLVDARIASEPNGGDPVHIDPWLELPVQAKLRGGEPLRAEALQQRCAGRHCGHAALWVGPKAAKPLDLLIALDVSPSTEGPAAGRLLPAIAALLAAAPEGSRVRALAFAGRSTPLIETPAQPGQVALAPFAQAIADAGLGSATRFEAAFRLARAWLLKNSRRGLRPLIAIIGDGGLTRGAARPFELARSAGIEVDAVNVSDRATLDALASGVGRTGGVALEVGSEAEEASRGRDPKPLEERLGALFAPAIAARVRVQGPVGTRVELGPLRAGEAITWRGAVPGPFSLAYDELATGRHMTVTSRSPGMATAGAAWQEVLVAIDPQDMQPAAPEDWPASAAKGRCDRRGPARRRGGISSDAEPVALAEERACRSLPAVSQRRSDVGVGMPSEPLLAMLRQRILPVARGCFRSDRAGRSQYQHRAVFVFSLAEREVASGQVEGAIPDALRNCLLAAVDQLEVPRFSGVVNVRYPLITESVPLPEQIELKADTSGTLDRLFGDPPTPGQHSLDALDSALHTPPASSVERVHD